MEVGVAEDGSPVVSVNLSLGSCSNDPFPPSLSPPSHATLSSIHHSSDPVSQPHPGDMAPNTATAESEQYAMESLARYVVQRTSAAL